MRKDLIPISKFLSLVLRHRPDTIGVDLDAGGWIEVEALLKACAAKGHELSREQLEEVVTTNDKRRFSFSADGRRIRANQGHSIAVELGLPVEEPPELLYHGTIGRFLPSIRRSGLLKGKRRHVHLSPDMQTAVSVGGRRGKPAILVVEAGRMFRAGHEFFVSENGVWLTESVPAEYLRFPEE